MVSKELKVFVYGTLKVGGRFANRFDKHRTSVRVGKVKGDLYSLVSYPGAKLGGDSVITGEVHTYTEPTEVEAALDRIEGFIGPGHKHNLYNKRTVQVDTDDGVEICTMYELAGSVNTLKKVDNGIWEI
jgi:gamma-glutamylcyclotransferase (GGCT)/AIG2-like uncharacterized protein YtfP